MKHIMTVDSSLNLAKNCLLKLKAIYFYPILSLSLLLFSCSSSYITYDYDHSQIFSEYKTYDFMNYPELNRNNSLGLDTSLYNKIRFTVNTVLSKKGFTLAESSKPDFVVSIHSNKLQEDSSYQFHPWWLPCGSTSVGGYDENTLVIDIADRNRELIWRGLVYRFLKSYSNSEYLSEELNDTIKSLVEKFPPS